MVANLRDEGGGVTIAVLEEWDWPMRKGLAPTREKVLGCFRNQVHRMDYPTYEASGWFIGSDPVESACKAMVGQRLKGPGMRWSEPGRYGTLSNLRKPSSGCGGSTRLCEGRGPGSTPGGDNGKVKRKSAK